MKRTLLSLLAGTALACALAAPALADSADDSFNPWQIRVRALGVLPDSSGSSVNVAGAAVPASLSIGNSIVPEADVTYYFTQNWSVEAIAGITPHRITATGVLSPLAVGRAWLLPPTVTAQYHFTSFGALKPYIGAGVNYTVFFDQKAADAPLGGLEVTGLHVKNTFGAALQAGFDYMLDSHWGLNFDAKKLLLEPDYTATVDGTVPVNGTAHINPWLVGTGITYKF
ncbi:MAG: OmpW family outer membrane protein [Rhizomicrobium sp.]|jgi:outer membrane protein